jgi:hypothetical protein
MEGQSSAPPTLVSLLICDQVIDDKLTNKKSAIGLFNMIMVPKTPAVIQHMCVLASVTEITAKTQIEARLTRDADDSLLFGGKGFVSAPDPLAVVDLIFSIQGIRVPDPGQYAFEILHEGNVLGRRRFQVVIAKRPGPPQSGRPPTPPSADN